MWLAGWYFERALSGRVLSGRALSGRVWVAEHEAIKLSSRRTEIVQSANSATQEFSKLLLELTAARKAFCIVTHSFVACDEQFCRL